MVAWTRGAMTIGSDMTAPIAASAVASRSVRSALDGVNENASAWTRASRALGSPNAIAAHA